MRSFLYGILISFSLVGCNEEEEKVKFNISHVNSEHNIFCVTFSSHADEVYFTRAEGVWGKEQLNSSIFYSKRVNNNWTIPKKVGFSEGFKISSPHLTADGKRLYYVSFQPIENDSSSNIWYVERSSLKDDWGIPQALDFKINSAYSEYSPKTTSNGDLYFASSRPGGFGQGDLYVSKNNNGEFSKPINLGSVVNSEKGEWNLELNPNGDVLIFEASQRPDNKSSFGDLYISFKRNEIWDKPINIEEINTTGSDLYATILGDNLYYSSSDSLTGPRTILKVTSFRAILEKYRSISEY